MQPHDPSPTPIPTRPKGFSLGTAPVTPSSPQPRPKSRRFFLPTLFGVLGCVFILSTLSVFVGLRFTQSLHFENRTLSFFQGVRILGDSFLGTGQTLAGEAEGRVNILLLGRAGEKYPGRNLTDTVMLLSLDTEQKRVGLLSLPRDLFAPIPDTGLSTKLNSLYQIGLNEGIGTEILRQSVAEITGQPIHYSAMIDFDGFERVIDALGGIRIEVMRDIYDPRYPGKNYSYETFELKQGWQLLDGPTALKYARERHADPEGDFGRTKRQQQIMQAVRDKLWSAPTLLNPLVLSGVLTNLGESVTTDIPPEALGRLIDLARSFDTHNLSTVVVDAWKKDSLLRVSHVAVNGINAFILVPRSGTWDELHATAATLFETHDQEARQREIQGESAAIVILTSPGYRLAAETLARDIRENYPIASVTLSAAHPLVVSGETAIIQDMRQARVPYTLDSLVKRYGLTVGTLPIPTRTIKSTPDLVIYYPKNDFAELFTLDRTDISLDDHDFQEPLAPMKNPYIH